MPDFLLCIKIWIKETNEASRVHLTCKEATLRCAAQSQLNSCVQLQHLLEIWTVRQKKWVWTTTINFSSRFISWQWFVLCFPIQQTLQQVSYGVNFMLSYNGQSSCFFFYFLPQVRSRVNCMLSWQSACKIIFLPKDNRWSCIRASLWTQQYIWRSMRLLCKLKFSTSCSLSWLWVSRWHFH